MRVLVLLYLTSLLCTALANFREAEIIQTSRRAQFHGVRTTSHAHRSCSVAQNIRVSTDCS